MQPVSRPAMAAVLALKFDPRLTLRPDAEDVTAVQTLVDGTSTIVKTEPQYLFRDRAPEANAVISSIPILSASVETRGYRTAGSVQIEIPLRSLPINPQALSAIGIDLHLDAITTAQAANMARWTSGQPCPLVCVPSQDNWLLSVVIDEAESHWGTDGEVLSLSGRDVRGILLDTPVEFAPGAGRHIINAINLDQPVTDVVRQLLSFHPQLRRFSVVANAAEWPDNAIPHVADPATAPRHRMGARGTRKSPHLHPQGAPNSNFWDLIVRWCFLVGTIPTIRGNDIVIRPSRTVFDQLANDDLDPVRNPTPFAGGRPRGWNAEDDMIMSPVLRHRTIVYGRDVNDLKLARKYGGQGRPRVIRCIGTDVQGGKVVQVMATWPRLADLPKSTRDSSTGGKQLEIVDIPVHGVWDPERLEEVARALFEETGRGEIGGSFSTHKLSSFGGGDADPDMTRLRTGDGVEILMAARPRQYAGSDTVKRGGMSFEEEIVEINRQVGNPDVSRLIVATRRGRVEQLTRFFRISGVHYTYGMEGLQIEADFQNYIIAQYEQSSARSMEHPSRRTTQAVGGPGVLGNYTQERTR